MSRRLVLDLMSTAPVWRLTPAGAARVRGAAPDDWEVVVVQAPTVSDGDGARTPSDEALAAIAEAEAYVGFGISPPLFDAAPRLRWVHSATAGVGGSLFPALCASEVALTNSAGVHAVPIAEQVLAGVLHFLRGLDVALAQQRAGRWDRAPFIGEAPPVREVADCTVLVVGAGGIGTAVAERFTALGARCLGIRRRPALGAPPGFAEVHGPEALEALLPRADVLVLSAPLTGETGGLVDARRLSMLPRGAIVANVARGGLLDEAALRAALAAGALRGAVLDVFAEEPLPAHSPWWGDARAVVTPHVSGVSPHRFWDRELALVLDNWARYRAGAPLRNLVDRAAGY